MYLHLGEKTVIRTENIIGIFDLDNSTISKHTRDFLAKAEKRGEVVNVSYELPKSFIIFKEDNIKKVFLSQISAQTLYRRIISNAK